MTGRAGCGPIVEVPRNSRGRQGGSGGSGLAKGDVERHGRQQHRCGLLAENYNGRTRAKLDQCTDGLSKTIALGEAAERPEKYVRGRSVDNFPTARVNGGGSCRPEYGSEGTSVPHSFHPGIVNVMMGDGSVRGVNKAVEMRVFAGMVTRAGGELVGSSP